MVTGKTAPYGADGHDEQFDRSAVLGLVADVGGTHIRFGIAVGGDSSPVNVHCVRRYAVRAHESIAHAAQHYRSATPGIPASRYMRGVTRLKKGDKGGREDIETALRMSPSIAEFYARHGVSPTT